MSDELSDMHAESLLANAKNARECGYDLCCSYCGEGLASDDFDAEENHDYWCPTLAPEFRAQHQADEEAFAERIGHLLERDE